VLPFSLKIEARAAEAVCGRYSVLAMAEVCDPARMIQRVIDDKYPNTRLLWQSLQQQTASRPYVYTQTPAMTFNRSVPITVTRSWDAARPSQEGRRDELDKVVQRVIDLRYPETRQIWMHSREEPVYQQTSAQRRAAATRTATGVGLPGLNPPDDPRRTQGTISNRPRTVPIPH
jgi:hypothetical protein